MKHLRLAALSAIFALQAQAVLADPAYYDSPDAAVEAVIVAVEAKDATALITVFGPENEDLVLSGNPDQDREDWREFYRAYQEMHRVAVQSDGSARLYIGRNQEVFPVSIVKGSGGWHFDVEDARETLALTRIGRNELAAIDEGARSLPEGDALLTGDVDGTVRLWPTSR